MIETKSFFKSLDTVVRSHWKIVHKYNIYLPELARGSCSVVYLGEEEERQIAIKTYSRQWIFDHKDIVNNEIEHFLKFSKFGLAPNLLRKPVPTNNNIYLIMELCNRGSLDSYIKKGIRFPTSVLREIAYFMGSVLEYFRSQGIIHRDINPQHILVSSDSSGRASYKLTGLQFCKTVSEEKVYESFVGTVEYSAPEVGSENLYSLKTDVWSLGILLYELALGAFYLKVDATLRGRVRRGDTPFFPPSLAIDPALQNLITKCLMYNPSRRPTPAEILAHPFLTGTPLVKSPAVSVEVPGMTLPSTQYVDMSPVPSTQPSQPTPPPQYASPLAQKMMPAAQTLSQPTLPEKAATLNSVNPQMTPSKLLQVYGDEHTDALEEGPTEEEEQRLLELINEDLTKFMEYVNNVEDHKIKLKCEKRNSLEPYVLDSEVPINQGAFGEIYLCTRRTDGRKFALKLLKSEKMEDVKIASLLLGEIEIMLDLNSSPYAIGIEDYFVHNNDLNLVIEYCNGGDLDDYLRALRKTGKRLSIDKLQLIAWNIGLGLNEMHSRKIMHRDIKPKNILVVKEKDSLANVKLCDYGLSKQVAEHQEITGSTVLGTFDYFAPELYDLMNKRMTGEVTRLRYDHKIDVWSYGILLYFSLYGKTPLEPPGSKLQVIDRGIILYPAVEGIPAEYFNLIRRALTYEPLKRPSFAELLRDLFFFDYVFKKRSDISPYKITRAISERGKVSVHECKDGSNTYAMKTIDCNSREKKHLLGEVVSLIELKRCSNVVKLHDQFVVDGRVHLVVDHYPDGDLERYVARREEVKKPLTYDEQVFLAYCIIKGLHDVHSFRIMHRDIQPRNILLRLNSSGLVKTAVISDFGLSWTETEETNQPRPLAPYRSPEMTLPGHVGLHNSKTDIWSYGMVLYFLIFGVHPNTFPGNQNFIEVLKKGAPKFDEKKAGASKELFLLMMSCLKVSPKERPKSLKLLRDPVFAKYKS